LVEHGMGKDGSGRRSPWDLFAERQVHMRSGDESSYVVLSRSLQIGVAAGVLVGLALLALASYNAIASRLELAAAERAMAQEAAASAARTRRLADEAASLRQQSEAASREIEQLNAALEQAQAERTEALTASSEAGARAAELEAALAATTQESRKLATELAGTPAGEMPRTPETQNLLAEVTGLRAELARVNRETLALRRTATEARQALRDLQGGNAIPAPPQTAAGPPGATPTLAADAVRALQQDLAEAQATVATLSADLEALKGGAGPATEAVAELATLEEQLGSAHRRVEQLGVNLAVRQVDATGDAADAPADGAPLPSPPAPR
jgi:hypothetical protein